MRKVIEEAIAAQAKLHGKGQKEDTYLLVAMSRCTEPCSANLLPNAVLVMARSHMSCRERAWYQHG
tara:strand:- start:345 stop:542 length:198 start_codon:yes stop_codon:yes gene_type:complete